MVIPKIKNTPNQQSTPVKPSDTLGLWYQQFKMTLLIESFAELSQKSAINAVPDIIIEIVPGASLRHRKWHVPGHSTSSIRRSQTHHFGLTEGKSYWDRKLQREKNLTQGRAIMGQNWLKIFNRLKAKLNLQINLTGRIWYSRQINALQLPLKSHSCEYIRVRYGPLKKKPSSYLKKCRAIERVGIWTVKSTLRFPCTWLKEH